ncbi:MAG: 2-phospho-L-lactate guanylyltransferase [Rhodoglobus sp.]|nr:2-phospho-L-lactate guanylyltransferase [Rhodoglobus sp.]
MPDWSVVVPVKGTAAAKSRFGGPGAQRLALARAMALDTVEAALAAPGVAGVVVVTSPSLAQDFADLGASVVDDTAADLRGAIALGLAHTPPALGGAVLLGDIPALDPRELGAALAAAAFHPLALVADADGSGTVLTTALPGVAHVVGFGRGSRALHLASGYVELTAPWPSLRRDVDTAEHLAGLASLGPRTAALLAG